MRILHITGVRFGGGVPVYIEQLASRQSAEGAAVLVACPDSSHLAADCDRAGLDHTPWELVLRKPQSYVRGIREVRRLARSFNADIVHLHSSHSGLVGRLALPRSPQVIFQPHAWSFHAAPRGMAGLVRLVERAAGLTSATLICGANHEAEEGTRLLGAKPHIVPNAIDTDRYTPVDEAERAALLEDLLGAKPVGPVVGFIGRIANQKGLDVLLEAWPKVLASHPGAQLVVVGTGPQRIQMLDIAPPSVRFIGEVEDTIGWHRSVDVAVVPSRYETLSLSMLESLSCGTPVVGTEVGGAAEVLGPIDGEAAVLVPTETPDALAAGIEQAIAFDRARVGDAARRAVANYGLTQQVSSIDAVYRNALRASTKALRK